MLVTPGKIGFAYTDAFREQFDNENAVIITAKTYPYLIFFGDSLLWYLPLKDNTLPFSWVNRGIPGDVTPYMALRFQADVLQLQPKRLVLLAGINDIINALLGDVPYEEKEVDLAVSIIVKNIKAMAQQASKQGIQVFMSSILPVQTPMGKQIDNAVARAAILQVNTCLQQVCKAKHYQYIDCYSAFVDSQTGYMNRGLSVDGIHLKKAGYQILLDNFMPFLMQ